MNQNPTTFNDCRQLVKEKIPFSFNHVFADLEDSFTTGCVNKPPIYKIYSYSRDNPILVFDFGREKWIGLKDVSDDKISQLHMSLVDDAVISHWASHEELLNISKHGLFGEITNPKYTADKFKKARSEAELLAEYVTNYGPIHDHPLPGKTIKKIMVKNPVWFYKVVGMLAQNYATISENLNGHTTIYFFYAGGLFSGRFPRYINQDSALESLSGPCIIDSINLTSKKSAERMLALNGFELITPEDDEKYMGHLLKYSIQRVKPIGISQSLQATLTHKDATGIGGLIQTKKFYKSRSKYCESKIISTHLSKERN